MSNDSKDIGFVIGVVFVIVGSILFFNWSLFGNEIIIKLISLLFIFMGISGIGIDITKRTEDKGSEELAVGLAFIIGSMIIKSAINIMPNLVILFIAMIGALFIGTSIAKLIQSDSKLNNSSQVFYRIIIILGQISGSILSIIQLIEFLTS